MKFRRIAVLSITALALGACTRREPPAPAPAPAQDNSAELAAREQARRDSIAAAERARREAEARERAAAMARAREVLADVVYFEYDSDALTPQAEQRLQAKVQILRSNPTLQIRVEGHADERGSTEYNLALGQRRAETVRNYLANYGIEAGRINTLSYGEERPAVSASDESAWSRNRRAEFAVTAGEITYVPR